MKERNTILIPAAVRSAALLLIATRRSIAGAGVFAILPREIVKMISLEVWATRKDRQWIKVVTNPTNQQRPADFIELWADDDPDLGWY